MAACEPTFMERYDALVAQHIGTIRRMCWRQSYGDNATCADLMQECLVSLWLRLPTLRAGCTAQEEREWVKWCCRSVFSHLLRQHRLSMTGLTAGMADTLAIPVEDSSDAHELVEDLASGLTRREQRALALIIEGYNQKETAAILGIRADSMARLRQRIVQKMRQRLEEIKKSWI